MTRQQIHSTAVAVAFGLVVFVIFPAAASLGVSVAIMAALAVCVASATAAHVIGGFFRESPALEFDPAWETSPTELAKLG
ncbi:MAG TPA: hypothetical protein PLQ19_00745 [Aeromicrobium sp.]|nr:hypothetical protein [Aeromicrobium sp.]